MSPLYLYTGIITMSVIYGQISIDGKPISAEEIGLIDRALSAHGPDNSGVWIEGHVILGQRLMCFTPEDAFEQQPCISNDGNMILVSDARIDNRLELCVLLEIPTSEAKQLPDSIFILKAYQKWGIDCSVYIIGSFAFALWDKSEQRLILVRSHLGDRSLYYHFKNNTLTFSSMPKGLFALPYINRELDLQYIADYLVVAPPSDNTTFYKGVKRLLAGHLLTVTKNGIDTQCYWQLNKKKELKLKKDEEYIDVFNELFERVTADHLRSLSPVGIMMSGGFDSASVAAVAATQLKKQGKRIFTFTEVPRPGFDGALINGRYADETPYVLEMAKMYDNIDTNFIQSGGTFYLDDICTFFSAADIPFRNASNRTWFEAILAKAKQNQCRVLLTGSSGNLTISWNGSGLLPQLIKSGRLIKAWNETGNKNVLLRLRRFISAGIMPLLPAPIWNAVQNLRNPQKPVNKLPWQDYSPIRSEFAKQQHVIERASEKQYDFKFNYGANTKKSRIATFDFIDKNNSSDYASAYRSLFGVDLRDPTGDVRIVEFCLSLPEEQYQRNGISRWLLQRSMANRLPQSILHNPLRGLQSAGWYETFYAARHNIKMELRRFNSSSLAAEILDLDRMAKLLSEITTDNGDATTLNSNYRGVMERGLMLGSFLCWIENNTA